MGGGADVSGLIARVLAGDPEVREELRALPSRCVHDEAFVTPVTAAIRAGNHALLAELLEDDAVLEYCPALDEDEVKRARRMVAHGIGRTTEAAEAYLLEHCVVSAPYWQRPPLLEAARLGDATAIRLLVERGASYTSKDALGLDTLDLCLDHEDPSVVSALVLSAAETARPYGVSADQLERAVHHSAIWELLKSAGKLGAKSQRVAFNVACATLDLDAVEAMLDGGYHPSNAVTTDRHPAIEAATSRLAWTLGAADFPTLAAGFAHMYGHPDGTSITDADLFDDEGNPIGLGQANARRLRLNATYKRDETDPTFVPDDQLRRRLDLLDRLADAGLERGKYRGDVVSPVVATNRPELLARLKEMGFSTGPRDGSADISWAMLSGCFSMVRALTSHGHSIGREVKSHKEQYAAYRAWLETEGATVAAGVPPAPSSVEPVVERPRASWELAGESSLRARLVADPIAGAPARIRLSHDNVYGPIDGTEIFVRVGDPDAATAFAELVDTTGWTAAPIVEETLSIDGDELSRASVPEDEQQGVEIPWRADHEAELSLPSGRVRIEIAVRHARYAELNGILSDWVFDVR